MSFFIESEVKIEDTFFKELCEVNFLSLFHDGYLY